MSIETAYKIKRLLSEREDWKSRAEWLENKIEESSEKIEKIKEEIYPKFIQILAVFVAIIGFLFATIEFSKNMNFLEASGILLILAFILFLFLYILISQFRTKKI